MHTNQPHQPTTFTSLQSLYLRHQKHACYTAPAMHWPLQSGGSDVSCNRMGLQSFHDRLINTSYLCSICCLHALVPQHVLFMLVVWEWQLALQLHHRKLASGLTATGWITSQQH